MNLFQKLAEIRKSISVKKTGYNSFGKYNYYEIDEIYSQAKKLFAEYQIFTAFSLEYEPLDRGTTDYHTKYFRAGSIQEVTKNWKEADDETVKEKLGTSKSEKMSVDIPTRETHSVDHKVGIYKATLLVMNAEEPNEHFTMRIDSPLNSLKGSESQQVGSNNTYQSKYLYMDLLMLDDGATDPDKHETHGKK